MAATRALRRGTDARLTPTGWRSLVLEALALGTLAQSSLLLAGLLACWVAVPRRVVGALAGFGAGALIAAVSFDLIAEAEEPSRELGLWMLVGRRPSSVATTSSSASSAVRGPAARWGSSSAPSWTACPSR